MTRITVKTECSWETFIIDVKLIKILYTIHMSIRCSNCSTEYAVNKYLYTLQWNQKQRILNRFVTYFDDLQYFCYVMYKQARLYTLQPSKKHHHLIVVASNCEQFVHQVNWIHRYFWRYRVRLWFAPRVSRIDQSHFLI